MAKRWYSVSVLSNFEKKIAEQIRQACLDCKVVAIAKFEQEVQELAALGVPAFNMYSESGGGLARHAMGALALQPG